MKLNRPPDQTENIEEITPEIDDSPVEFMNSGCTILNLAISQKGRKGGWPRGRIINLVGDGSSGKTLLSIELAAWCFHNIKKLPSKLFPAVKKIRIIHDNVESVMDFPIEKMYGKAFKDAVYPPENSPEYERGSRTVEEFGRRFTSLLFNP